VEKEEKLVEEERQKRLLSLVQLKPDYNSQSEEFIDF